MGQDEVGMLGPRDTLLDVGGPLLPHVVLFEPILEQARGQEITK